MKFLFGIFSLIFFSIILASIGLEPVKEEKACENNVSFLGEWMISKKNYKWEPVGFVNGAPRDTFIFENKFIFKDSFMINFRGKRKEGSKSYYNDQADTFFFFIENDTTMRTRESKEEAWHYSFYKICGNKLVYGYRGKNPFTITKIEE